MRRLIALLALATSALILTPPASAGGPTSVLITEPGTGEATALYYSDPGYAELDSLATKGVKLEGEPGNLGNRVVHLTWMVHDVSPWRTQQLYVEAEGGPVLATSATEQAGESVWTRVALSKAVVGFVDELLQPGYDPDAIPAAAPAEPVVTERVLTETAWYSLAGWRWLVLGLLVGAGAVLLVRRTRESAPRQVLVDLDPASEPLAPRR